MRRSSASDTRFQFSSVTSTSLPGGNQPDHAISISVNDDVTNVVNHSDRLITNLAIVMPSIFRFYRWPLEYQGGYEDVDTVFGEIGLALRLVPLKIHLRL